MGIYSDRHKNLITHEVKKGEIYWLQGYEPWKVIDWNTTEGMNGYPKDYALMLNITNNQMRAVTQKSFRKSYTDVHIGWREFQNIIETNQHKNINDGIIPLSSR